MAYVRVDTARMLIPQIGAEGVLSGHPIIARRNMLDHIIVGEV